MGTNRRYAAYFDGQTDGRIKETFIAKSGPLQSLTPEEIEADRLPMTIYPEGIDRR